MWLGLYISNLVFPLIFGGECVFTAVFLINRTPSSVLDWKSTCFYLYQDLLDYSSLKVFGSLCFASTLCGHRTKLNHRARQAIFVGYPLGMKDYHLYNIDNHKFFVLRDVVFHEDVFPFLHGSIPNHEVDPFPNSVLPKAADFHGDSPIAPIVTTQTGSTHVSNPQPPWILMPQIILMLMSLFLLILMELLMVLLLRIMEFLMA